MSGQEIVGDIFAVAEEAAHQERQRRGAGAFAFRTFKE